MFETLKKAEGVGLAAPQVGLPIRVVVIDLDCISEDEPQFKGYLKAFINGHIIESSKEENSFEEGCLSVPGIHESVKRPEKVRIQYLDADLQPHDEWVDGFVARVIQHEFDHLEGKMFVDRLSPLRKQIIKNHLLTYIVAVHILLDAVGGYHCYCKSLFGIYRISENSNFVF
jgi:peptide deformylase